jgi:signal transduction histidine kinase
METYLKNLDAAELQKAKLVIGQFITSCSHTMRGPLKSITGLVNLLQNSENYSPKDVAMFLNLIGSTINKMERTLDELEHFLENSKRKIKLKPVDCREMLNTVVRQYEDEIHARQIKINLDIQQKIPFSSDVARLRIILSNLLSNAIQFRDVNKKIQTISISVKVTAQTCILSIEDNGVGVDKENHAKIFQLFFRATERSSGAGIGLYVVKEAVEKMGGKINLHSTPGKGSVFTVTLLNLANKKTASD